MSQMQFRITNNITEVERFIMDKKDKTYFE